MGVKIVFHISVVLLSLAIPSLALRIQPLSLGEEQCGPKLSIETPECTLEDKRIGYELRYYPHGQDLERKAIVTSRYVVLEENPSVFDEMESGRRLEGRRPKLAEVEVHANAEPDQKLKDLGLKCKVLGGTFKPFGTRGSQK